MRPLHLIDIPALHRYRKQLICLDSTYLLTRGCSLTALSVLLDHIALDHDSYVGVRQSEHYRSKLFGRVLIDHKTRTANLNFITPKDLNGSTEMCDLINDLCKLAGSEGVVCVRAEVEVGDPTYAILLKHGFKLYDRQRIWRLTNQYNEIHINSRWESAHELDWPGIQQLFYSLVPPMVQAAKPFGLREPNGLVYRQNGEILGYLETHMGPNGIVLKPLLHPALENAGELLHDIYPHFAPLMGRPIYVAVPSYLGWLESQLYDQKAQVFSLRTMMVRYLAQTLKVLETEYNHGLETIRPQASHYQPAEMNHKREQ